MRYPLHNSSGYTDCLPADTGRHRSSAVCRKGFTLIEMLITITILGILAAAVMGALQSARETAKAAKTKSTITKLHYIIMARYDSYRTRRVPVDVRQYVDDNSDSGEFYFGWNKSLAYAHLRLLALRDLMRMEMPDRWSDVINGTIAPIDQPSISSRYLRLYNDAVANVGATKVATHAAAECLYMIVMSIPEAAEQFQNTEIGDVDSDGLNEFVDGWGHPISFIRWPVGFVEYNNLLALNPTGGGNPKGPAGQENEDPLPWSPPSDLQSGDLQSESDSFDSMGVGGGFTCWNGVNAGAGYTLFPLIYSAGPDATYDININGAQPVHGPNEPVSGYVNPLWRLDPYVPLERSVSDNDGNTLVYLAQPIDSDSLDGTAKNNELNHYDNIHNHMLEVR